MGYYDDDIYEREVCNGYDYDSILEVQTNEEEKTVWRIAYNGVGFAFINNIGQMLALDGTAFQLSKEEANLYRFLSEDSS